MAREGESEKRKVRVNNTEEEQRKKKWKGENQEIAREQFYKWKILVKERLLAIHRQK